MVPEVMVMGRRSGVCNGWFSGSSQCSFYIIYLLSSGIEYVLFATLKELNCKRVAESLGRGGDGYGRCFG